MAHDPRCGRLAAAAAGQRQAGPPAAGDGTIDALAAFFSGSSTVSTSSDAAAAPGVAADRGAAALRARNQRMTRQLSRAASLREVADLVAEAADAMDGITVTAVMTRAARLAPPMPAVGAAPGPGVRSFLTRAAGPLLASKAALLDAAGLGMCLHALARLGGCGMEQLVQLLVGRVVALLPDMAPRDLSSVLWALCHSPRQPAPQLLQQLAAAAQATLPAANPQDCCMTIWGLARCGGVDLLAGAWMDAFLRRTRPMLADMDARQVAQLAYGLAAARRVCQPGSAYLADLLAAARRTLPGAPGQAVGILAYALALVRPDEQLAGAAWREDFVAAAQGSLPGCSAHNLASLAMLLGAWQHVPAPGWLDAYWQVSYAAMPEFTAQGLALMGANLAALQLQPPAPWVDRFCQAACDQGAAGTPAGCACIARALGAWRASPPRPLLAQCSDCLAREAERLAGPPGFSPQQLALTLWGLGRLRCRTVGPRVVIPLLQELQPRLAELAPGVTAHLLTAAVQLRVAPPRAWLAQAAQAVAAQADAAGPAATVRTLVALAAAAPASGADPQLRLDAAVVAPLAECAAAHAASLSSKHLCAAITALAVLQCGAAASRAALGRLLACLPLSVGSPRSAGRALAAAAAAGSAVDPGLAASLLAGIESTDWLAGLPVAEQHAAFQAAAQLPAAFPPAWQPAAAHAATLVQLNQRIGPGGMPAPPTGRAAVGLGARPPSSLLAGAAV